MREGRAEMKSFFVGRLFRRIALAFARHRPPRFRLDPARLPEIRAALAALAQIPTKGGAA